MSKSKKNAITELLEDPNKKIHETYGTNGMLSRMFRLILKDRGIKWYQYYQLMNTFLADPRNNIPGNKIDHTINRGNLNKEFDKPQMTWKVFYKGLRFLQADKFELSFKITWRNKEVSLHSLPITLNHDNKEIDENDTTPALDLEEIPYLDNRRDEEDHF